MEFFKYKSNFRSESLEAELRSAGEYQLTNLKIEALWKKLCRQVAEASSALGGENQEECFEP